MASDSPLILVVEDDDRLRRVTCSAIAAGPYRVVEAETGRQALLEVTALHPDLILLDLGLPDMSGIDVIHQLSSSRRPPVVVFSAGGVQRDKIEAIEAGAFDYVDKPFEVGDLLSRLRSALRRSKRSVNAVSHFTFGDIDIDLPSHRVSARNKEVSLSSQEFRLLAAVAKNAGRLLTYRFLLHEIQEPNEASDYSTLFMVVAQLRHKLEPDPMRPRYLIAEPGIGYRFRDE